MSADLGCNGGGEEIARTFRVDPGATDRTPGAGPAPTGSGPGTTDATAGGGPWYRGWTALVSWVVGVALLGPLVLGALVALVERCDADRRSPGESEEH